MSKRKFLILALLVAIALCWTVGPAAAQENPMPQKREQAWNAYQQWVPERLKGDPAFQTYMQIYNAREQALSNGSLIPKQETQGTKPSPQRPNPKGGGK